MKYKGFLWMILAALLVAGGIGVWRSDEIAARKQPAVEQPLPVPYISQQPDFPTGCESVSAVMLLQYHGVTLSVDAFVDDYLSRGEFSAVGGTVYGPDPRKQFIGDPRSAYGFGCYAPVIERALVALVGESRVKNTTGAPLSALCAQYIDNGLPVLVWGSIAMGQTAPGKSWILPDGETFTWVRGEHCLVLVGYDETQYYFHDPLAGAATGYPRAAVETAYAALFSQSLVILPAA